MPLNVFDPTAVSTFRQKAKEQGYSDSEIQGYLSNEIGGIHAREAKSPPLLSDKLSGVLANKITPTVPFLGKIDVGQAVGQVPALAEKAGRSSLAGISSIILGILGASGNKEAKEAIKRGALPFVSPEEGRTLTSMDPSFEASLKIAELGGKRGAGIASYALPTKTGGAAFTTGAGRGLSTALAQDEVTPESVVLSTLVGSGAEGILSNVSPAIKALRDKIKGKGVEPKVDLTRLQEEYAKNYLTRDVPDVPTGDIRADTRLYEIAAQKGDKVTMDALSAKHAGEPAWGVIQRAQADISDFDPSKLDPARQKALERALEMSKSQSDRVASGQSIDPTRNFLPEDQFRPATDQSDDIVRNALERSKAYGEANRMSESFKNYSKDFTIPTKKAGRDALDGVGTLKKMMEYDIPSNKVGEVSQIVTGRDGIVSSINREALNNVKGSVPVAGVLDDAVTPFAKSILTPDEIASQQQIIKQTLEANATGSASGALDAVRQLEELGYALQGKSTYLTQNLQAEAKGDIFLEAAKKLAGNVEKLAGNQDVLRAYKTPQVIEALSREVSPKFADQFAKATTVADMRSIQAPFVRASKIVDLTNQQQFSVGSKVAGGFINRATQPIVNTIVEPIASGVGNITSKIMDATRNLATGVGSKVAPVVDVGMNLAGGAAQSGINTLSNPLLQKAATQTAIQTSLPQNRPMQDIQPLPEEQLAPPEGLMFDQPQVQGASVQGQQMGGLNIDPNQLLIAMLEDPQNREVYQAIYDRITKGGAKPLNARQQILQKNALSGLDALGVMESKLSDPNLILQTGGIPFLSDNEYQSAERRVKDALRIVGGVEQGQGFSLGPLRVGGERSYEDYLPKIDDSPEDRVAKFELIKSLLADFAYGQQPSVEEVDTGGLLFNQ